MGATHLDELDVTTLKIGGVSTTPSNSVAADQIQTASGDGAVTIPGSQRATVFITKGSAAALTIADPASGTDDGKEILVISITAYAHTLSNAAGSGFFPTGGASKDVGTFGAAAGNLLRFVAYQGKWWVTQNTGVTLG